MSPVTNLKIRIRDYLGYESPGRAVLRATLDQLTEKLPDTAIFGGMLREFALENAKAFSSDIDLVAVAGRADIYRAIQDFSPRRNKFGGFRFTAGKWRFDIWAFDETWAFREGIVEGSEITDLFKTTFFNLDAALFHLSRQEFCYSAEYENGVRRRMLEINLAPNPAPARMARRAIRLAIERELAIGPELASFILSRSDECRIGGVYSLFIDDLNRHIRAGYPNPYSFRPQYSMDMR